MSTSSPAAARYRSRSCSTDRPRLDRLAVASFARPPRLEGSRPRYLLPVGTVSRPVGGVLSTLLRGMGGHPSKRPTWGLLPKERAGNPCPTLGLAPGGVYRAGRVAATAGALLPHRFTLACPGCPVIGGLFSVALSCGSPRLAVSQHPALWSPDLPRPVPATRRLGSRPPSRLTVLNSVPNPDRCPSFLA
jgi:hypothetical protein